MGFLRESQAGVGSLVEIYEPAAVDQIIEMVDMLVYEREGLVSSDAGRVALVGVVAVRDVLGPILADSYIARQAYGDVVEEKNGTSASLRIDWLAEGVLQRWLKRSMLPIRAYLEENEWADYGTVGDQATREAGFIVVADCLDETSEFRIGHNVQSAVVSVFGADGSFQACSIADFQSRNVLLAEGGKVRLPNINLNTGDGGQVQHSKRVLRVKPDPGLEGCIEEIKVATLPKRVLSYQTTQLYQEIARHTPFPRFPSLGGLTIMRMCEGTLDGAIDLFKGQPWYEMIPWVCYQQAGGVVVDDTGEEIQVEDVLIAGLEGEGRRHPFIAARTRTLAERILELATTQETSETTSEWLLGLN